jgi:DNA polymerase III delta prime subunit
MVKMEANKDQFLWTEKYRPRKIEDCILPEKMKNQFREMIAAGEIPNMLLAGGAGMGKTTVARAIADELDADVLFINASMESGIDVLRTKIQQFASAVSLMGGTKIVILDEADYTNPQSFQPALRGFIEEFSTNCRFIFTCNFKNRIISPLHSRTAVIEFKLASADKPKMASKFMKRVTEILEVEGVAYDEKVVAKLLMKYFPDYRRVLNELQRYASSGRIDEGILATIAEVNVKEILSALKDKDFKKMRSWVVNNMDNEMAAIYRRIYDVLLDEVNEVPQMVLILADYSYKSGFCVDQEINLTACLTEIMASCHFRQ